MNLAVDLFGARFRNPVMLAAGTCGFGEEVSEVIRLEHLGGIVTKSVTLEPRRGNAAPRVSELGAGMINSVGLANPGAGVVRDVKLPWIRDHLPGLQVFVSVAGHRIDEYFEVVEILDSVPGFLGYELNLSCPNDARRGGLPFALDPQALFDAVRGVRDRTDRPILAKLAPNTPDFAPIVRAAAEAGVDGLTLVNTLPGLALDPRSGRPTLGAGEGGVSGPALRAVGVRAVSVASSLTDLPLLGVGGIGTAEEAVQYFRAGASLVQIGTASFWNPRTAERVVDDLVRFGRSEGIDAVSELSGHARVRDGMSPERLGVDAPTGEEAVRG